MMNSQNPDMPNAPNEEQAEEGAKLEQGTYEVIRNRLLDHEADLSQRLNKLNDERKNTFGNTEYKLLTTERVNTQHNCVPRDIIAIGDQLLFGYNVKFGLKSLKKPDDVFAIYCFKEEHFQEKNLELLNNADFQKDFEQLYKYYKKTVFTKFAVIGSDLFMVFQTGQSLSDVKTFKWHIEGDELTYLGNRSDHEFKYPAQQEFEWLRTTRDQQRAGKHPHISIDDRVFVECIGGDLTIKVEDNTESGAGLYSESVGNPDQTLDDAEIYYSLLDHIILLKIKPYQETDFRYLIFNDKLEHVHRVDGIEQSCVLLPDDHGLIFSSGIYLQTGELRQFDNNLNDMFFEKCIQSPNGEDYLYVFYNRKSGTYALFSYNLIEQDVSTPLICHGHSFLNDGRMLNLRSQDNPQKHHPVQIWQSPYFDANHNAQNQAEGYLAKIGNKEIVRAMAECRGISVLLKKDEEYADLYVDIVKKATDIIDSYFWLKEKETYSLSIPLEEIRKNSQKAIDEYEKLRRLRSEANKRVKLLKEELSKLKTNLARRDHQQVEDFVASLSELRSLRGEIIASRDKRYIDTDALAELEKTVSSHSEATSQDCVDFLLGKGALDPYKEKIADSKAKIDDLETHVDAQALEQLVDETASSLELLVETVSSLKISDATHRTQIIDEISAIFSSINQTRALLKSKTKSLISSEGMAEFASQQKLLAQAVVNYLDLCDSPQKCDEYLTRLMVQLEELEGRFAEFDDFIEEIADKRQQVYDTFESRKLQLIEAQSKRAQSLRRTAERILSGVQSRISGMDKTSEIHAYFASDLMVEKVRNLIDQLVEIDDNVKADEIASKLKSLQETALRQLKDRQELFVDGENIIRFGQHQFSVNVQKLDLTFIVRDEQPAFHLTGTNYFDEINNPAFIEYQDLLSQDSLAENKAVYRAEYLAYSFAGAELATEKERDEFLVLEPEQQLHDIQQFMGTKYQEGYLKGVHDLDALKILVQYLQMMKELGLLRHSPEARSLALYFWELEFENYSDLWQRLKSHATVAGCFELAAGSQQNFVSEINDCILSFLKDGAPFDEHLSLQAAKFLYDWVPLNGNASFSATAKELRDSFWEHMKEPKQKKLFTSSLKELSHESHGKMKQLKQWAKAYIDSSHPGQSKYASELALLLDPKRKDKADFVGISSELVLDQMLGSHGSIQDSTLNFQFHDFESRLVKHEQESVPQFTNFLQLKKELLDEERDKLRLGEFEPKVLTSFVRNQLIDKVYLPLIGDNLAKQIGSTGKNKRTDSMGLLLLVSPPGYGKTTLMEYIANRLGLIFMKINGPSLGHQVLSLDPAQAPNAGAKQEVEKLNLALEMGDNVMIYLDDIQHCHPEFLQKFISLCDGQRRIEGVFRGNSKTYDLRGKKVAVVMAGNPYTESGDRFQIPDMLANRADTYNLGEVLGERDTEFKLSYLENCVSANPILSSLAKYSQQDILSMIRVAQGESPSDFEFEGNFNTEQLEEFTNTFKKLLRIQEVILTVNQEYIRSAAQADNYRTEPPFKLQGSYRNMNKLAEKVLPIMNEEEVEELILSHYESESQTLTQGTEANMLKLKELLQIQTTAESQRWTDIKKTFVQQRELSGIGEDNQAAAILLQLRKFSDGLDSICDVLSQRGGKQSNQADLVKPMQQMVDEMLSALSDRQADQDRPIEVQVVSKVPQSILNVIRRQFRLLESWIPSILNLAKQDSTSMDKLGEQLQIAKDEYDQLQSDLEEGEKRKE